MNIAPKITIYDNYSYSECAYIQMCISFVLNECTLISYLIETVHQFELVFRESMSRGVYQHIFEIVVRKGTFALYETVFSAEACRHGRVQHESLRHSEQEVESASTVVHTNLSHRHVRRTV